MDISKIRDQFVLCLLSEKSSVLEVVPEVKESGFHLFTYSMEMNNLDKIAKNSPHIIFVDITSLSSSVDLYLEKIQQVAPGALIVTIVAGQADIEKTEKIAYESVFKLYATAERLVRIADRGCEKKYLHMKINKLEKQMESKDDSELSFAVDGERLSFEEEDEKNFSVEENIFLDSYLSGLESVENIAEVIKVHLEELSKKFFDNPVLFFNYVENKKTLILSDSVSINNSSINGIGCKVNVADNAIEKNIFASLETLIQSAFKVRNFEIDIIKCDGDIVGVTVVLDNGDEELQLGLLALMNRICGLRVENIQRKFQLHKAQVFDPVTSLLSFDHLEETLRTEVSRARRIEKPLSMIMFSVDRFYDYKVGAGELTSNRLLVYVSKLLRKSGRLTDVLLDLKNGDFAVILPHTKLKGAGFKAEKTRRIIEKSVFEELKDFSNGRITISAGVAEYPGNCIDGDGLLKASDDALFCAKKYDGGNKVCFSSLRKNEGFFESNINFQDERNVKSRENVKPFGEEILNQEL